MNTKGNSIKPINSPFDQGMGGKKVNEFSGMDKDFIIQTLQKKASDLKDDYDKIFNMYLSDSDSDEGLVKYYKAKAENAEREVAQYKMQARAVKVQHDFEIRQLQDQIDNLKENLEKQIDSRDRMISAMMLLGCSYRTMAEAVEMSVSGVKYRADRLVDMGYVPKPSDRAIRV